jgi:hypothetical protein
MNTSGKVEVSSAGFRKGVPAFDGAMLTKPEALWTIKVAMLLMRSKRSTNGFDADAGARLLAGTHDP